MSKTKETEARIKNSSGERCVCVCVVPSQLHLELCILAVQCSRTEMFDFYSDDLLLSENWATDRQILCKLYDDGSPESHYGRCVVLIPAVTCVPSGGEDGCVDNLILHVRMTLWETQLSISMTTAQDCSSRGEHCEISFIGCCNNLMGRIAPVVK